MINLLEIAQQFLMIILAVVLIFFIIAGGVSLIMEFANFMEKRK
jgi:hypothetical protein